jgi:hypothetical protein
LELFDQGFSEIELVKDLSGNDRFVIGKKRWFYAGTIQ